MTTYNAARALVCTFVILSILLFSTAHAQTGGACCIMAPYEIASTTAAPNIVTEEIICVPAPDVDTCTAAKGMFTQGETCATQPGCVCCPDNHRIVLNTANDKRLCIDPAPFLQGTLDISVMLNAGFSLMPACVHQDGKCAKQTIAGNEATFVAGYYTENDPLVTSVLAAEVDYCANCPVEVPNAFCPSAGCFCAEQACCDLSVCIDMEPRTCAKRSASSFPTGYNTDCASVSCAPIQSPPPPAPFEACNCPRAEVIPTPTATFTLSCASAAQFQLQSVAYSNSHVMAATEGAYASACLYSGLALPTPSEIPPGSLCGYAVELTWSIPTHPSCTTTESVETLHQTIIVQRAASAVLTNVVRDSTLSCTEAERALTLTYESLSYSNGEQTSPQNCLVAGSIPVSGEVVDHITTCGGTDSQLHITWSGITSPCDPPLTHTQHIFVTPATKPSFNALPHVQSDPLTCVQATLRAFSVLEYDNGIGEEENSRCRIAGSVRSEISCSPALCGTTLTEEWHAEDVCGRKLQSAYATYSVEAAPQPSFSPSPPEDEEISCAYFVDTYQPALLTYDNGVDAEGPAGVCALYGVVEVGSPEIPLRGSLERFDMCGSSEGIHETWLLRDACERTLVYTRTLTVAADSMATCCVVCSMALCDMYGTTNKFVAPRACFYPSFSMGKCARLDGVAGIAATADECATLTNTGIGLDNNCNGVDENNDGTADEGWVEIETICGTGECFRRGVLQCVDGVVVNTCTPGQKPAQNDTNCNQKDSDCNGLIDDGLCAGHGTCIRETAIFVGGEKEGKKKKKKKKKKEKEKETMCHIPPNNPESAHTIFVSANANALKVHRQRNRYDIFGPCPLCECVYGYSRKNRCTTCVSVASGDLAQGNVAVCRKLPNEDTDQETYELLIVCADDDENESEDELICSGQRMQGDIEPTYDARSGLDCACQAVVGACYLDSMTCHQATERVCNALSPRLRFQGNYSQCPDCTAKIVVTTDGDNTGNDNAENDNTENGSNAIGGGGDSNANANGQHETPNGAGHANLSVILGAILGIVVLVLLFGLVTTLWKYYKLRAYNGRDQAMIGTARGTAFTSILPTADHDYSFDGDGGGDNNIEDLHTNDDIADILNTYTFGDEGDESEGEGECDTLPYPVGWDDYVSPFDDSAPSRSLHTLVPLPTSSTIRSENESWKNE